jgi:MOSC domain-containing protein YiiM
MGRHAARTVVRRDGIVGWYLRVLVPGEVPAQGTITVTGQHPAGVTVAMAHAALQDRSGTYPDLARLPVMSTSLRGQLMRRNRDLTGGVPEHD